MQKNIVFGVNAAMSGQSPEKKQNNAVSEEHNRQVASLEADIAHLKSETSKFAVVVEEMQAQNEELRNKIDELIAAQVAPPPKEKKKRSGKKSSK
tara:strand:- start:415 stop:699 length:285 start_codon:yes stop_codon:yes gene_type:complete